MFISFKGCIRTVMVNNDYKFYVLEQKDSAEERVIFFPDNKILVLRLQNDLHEMGFFKFYSEGATHYFGPFYNTGTFFPFGLRIYSNAESVWKLKLDLRNKFGNVYGSTFPEIGSELQTTLILYDSSMKFHGEIYDRYYLNKLELEDFLLIADSLVMFFDKDGVN